MVRTHRTLPWIFAVAVCLMVSPLAAKADTAIYDNFTEPGQTFNANIGTELQLEPYTNHESQAMPFTASGNFDLTEIDIALAVIDSSDPSDVNVTLNADSSGSPGSVIESWDNVTASTAWNYFYVEYPPEALLSSPGVVLTAGQQYWVVATATNFADMAWNVSNYDSGPYQTFSDYDYAWHPKSHFRGAYDVLGNPPSATPEPCTLLLLGTGIASGLARRRRK